MHGARVTRPPLESPMYALCDLLALVLGWFGPTIPTGGSNYDCDPNEFGPTIPSEG